MHISMLVLAGLLITLVIFLGIKKRKKSTAKKREAQAKHQADLTFVNNWISRVEHAGNDKELFEIEELPYEYRKHFEGSRLKAAREKHFKASISYGCEEESQRVASAIRDLEDPAALVRAKINLVRKPDKRALEILNTAVESLEKEIRQWFEDALEAARSGDKNQFFAICNFMEEEPATRSSKGISFDYPDDWFDLVAQNVENPNIKDFAILNTDVEDGSIRQLAAEAIRDRSLTKAKIALAFCAISKYHYKHPKTFPHRDEIGDVMMADLAKMVAELHAEACMFVHTES